MFSKKNNAKANSTGNAAKPEKPAVPSIISADLTITGNLVSAGEVQIDGNVIGDIKTDALLIGEDAKVQGEIVARRVRVHGHVDGQITAKSVTLAKTAHVTGDVIHEDLSIEKGAFLEGHCKRIAEEKTLAVAGDRRSSLKEVTPPVPGAPLDKAGPALARPSSGNGSEESEAEKTEKTDKPAIQANA